MSIIDPILKNLDNVKKDLPNIAEKALKENYSEIVMLVKAEQLGKGLNSWGKPLKWAGGTGFYAPATQEIYNAETSGFMGGNQVPKTVGRPYNFSWTGQTLDNTQMQIKKAAYEFEIFTIRGKQRYLEMIYGEIFKLTKEHNDYVNEEILLPYLYNHILNNLLNI